MPYVLARDIQTCRGHHAVLREQVARFPDPVAANAAQLRAALGDFGTVLGRHLEFEDQRVYPVLETAEPAIAERACRYRDEMGHLSGSVTTFLERWSTGGAIEAEPQTFAREWDAVRAALERRMAAEDDDLYEIAEHFER